MAIMMDSTTGMRLGLMMVAMMATIMDVMMTTMTGATTTGIDEYAAGCMKALRMQPLAQMYR